jgi:hypothetical protein
LRFITGTAKDQISISFSFGLIFSQFNRLTLSFIFDFRLHPFPFFFLERILTVSLATTEWA